MEEVSDDETIPEKPKHIDKVRKPSEIDPDSYTRSDGTIDYAAANIERLKQIGIFASDTAQYKKLMLKYKKECEIIEEIIRRNKNRADRRDAPFKNRIIVMNTFIKTHLHTQKLNVSMYKYEKRKIKLYLLIYMFIITKIKNYFRSV